MQEHPFYSISLQVHPFQMADAKLGIFFLNVVALHKNA